MPGELLQMKSNFDSCHKSDGNSSCISVKAVGLGKCYKVYDSISDRIKQTIAGNRVKLYRDFWALKDVNFSLCKGETVGIVGKNGSGKSTLLQLICGILSPTTGSIHTDGKIAALLELGTGFSPEFTGHENIYMNGTLLGLRKQQINELYDSILSFADIGDCINQPVKTYSSGMLIRLAFAVATSAIPDLLIVDEALAVGDEYFQKKCYSRIRELQENGCTIIFVSHALQNIISFCSQAMLIDDGELLALGAPKPITNIYQKLIYASSSSKYSIKKSLKANQVFVYEDKTKLASPDIEYDRGYTEKNRFDWFDADITTQHYVEFEQNGASIQDPKIINNHGHNVNVLRKGHEYTLTFQAELHEGMQDVYAGAMIRTSKGINISGIKMPILIKENQIDTNNETQFIVTSIPFKCLLNHGLYSINLTLFNGSIETTSYAARILDAIAFKVINDHESQSLGLVDIFQSTCLPAKASPDKPSS